MPILKSFFSPRSLILVFVSILPALLTAYFFQQEFLRVVGTASEENAHRIAFLVTDQQNQVLDTARQTLSTLSLWFDPAPLDRDACSQNLNELLFRNEGMYQNILIASPQGDVLCSGQPLPASYSPAENPVFKQVLQTQAATISNSSRDPLTNEFVIFYGYPILRSSDKLEGVMIASVRLSWLDKQLARLDLDPQHLVSLIDFNGVILAHHPQAGEWLGRPIPVAQTALSMINRQDEATFSIKEPAGITRQYNLIRLPPPYPAYLLIQTSEAPWVSELKTRSTWAWITILFSLLLFLFIVSGLLVNFINKPLIRFRSATEALLEGDTSVHLDMNFGSTEMNRLAQGINRLVSTSRQQQAEHQAAEQLIRRQEMQFHAIADLSINWEYWINPDGSYGYVSPACERISGYRGDEFSRDWEMLQTIVHPDDRDRITTHLKSDHTNEKNQISEIEFRILTKDGRLRWIHHTCQPVLNSNREYLGRRAVNQDITERKKVEEALRSSEERNREIIDDYGEGIAIINADEVFTFINPIGEQIFGRKNEAIIGHRLYEFIPPDQIAHLNRQIDIRKAGERTTYDMDIIRSDGQRRNLIITATAQNSFEGSYIGTLGTFRDITDIRQREEGLRFTSTHDHLTGLLNRQFLTEEIAHIQNGNEWPVSIIVVDMDDLKKINDKYGHIAGDDALKRTADLLQKAFRPGDVIARFGGDEFVVLLPGVNAEAGQEIYARVESILAAYNTEHPDLPILVSLGLSTGFEGTPLTTIFDQADEIMYKNKQRKGDQA